MGCHFPLQGVLPTLGLNAHLLHWQVDCLPLSPAGEPPIWQHPPLESIATDIPPREGISIRPASAPQPRTPTTPAHSRTQTPRASTQQTRPAWCTPGFATRTIHRPLPLPHRPGGGVPAMHARHTQPSPPHTPPWDLLRKDSPRSAQKPSSESLGPCDTGPHNFRGCAEVGMNEGPPWPGLKSLLRPFPDQ